MVAAARHQRVTTAQAHADAYKPTPYTVCVTTLRNRAMFGRGVFDAAIPAPIAGCITKNGAMSVTELTIRAGNNVGRFSHSNPEIVRSNTANTTPIV